MVRWFFVCVLGVSSGVVAMGLVAHAQVMQSPSYQIQSDSVNIGGGRSTSTNYIQEATVGEVGTGRSTSSSFNLYAGYQQMQEVYLSLSAAPDVIMNSTLPGIGGGESNGSTTVTVITDSASGYQLTIESSNDPAMQSPTATIADYAPATPADPDLHFTTDAPDAHFAYSSFGVDTALRFQTNGTVCNVSGSASSTACWFAPSTTPITIAQAPTANHPDGATTTVHFKVGLGASTVVESGTYIATSTLTLLPL